MKQRLTLIFATFVAIILSSLSTSAARKYSVILHNYASIPLKFTFSDIKKGFEEDPFYTNIYEVKDRETLILFDNVEISEAHPIGSELIELVGVRPYSAPTQTCRILLFTETKGSVLRFKYNDANGIEQKFQLGYKVENKRIGSDQHGNYQKTYHIYFKRYR